MQTYICMYIYIYIFAHLHIYNLYSKQALQYICLYAKSSKMVHFVFKCSKEDYLSVCMPHSNISCCNRAAFGHVCVCIYIYVYIHITCSKDVPQNSQKILCH